MHRTLRFQLIAIVVGTVVSVLVASQWLDTTLSESALERDLKERAFLALGTVESLWARAEPAELADPLETIVHNNRELAAIDIFRLDGPAPQVTVSTRPRTDTAPPMTADEARHLAADGSAHALIHEPEGGTILRVALPLRRDGAVVGAARADVSLAEAASLRHRLRAIDGGFLLVSTTLTSLALAFFLERRVTRPVAALVDGMRRAEGGSLGARVASTDRGELGFLAGHFNSMLSRIEDLTTGLESRVRQATRDLADKNRELQEANEKLWRAQLEVVRNERFAALGQMAGTIAHELGTPLNSVLGYTQLLLREEVPAQQAAKLAIVESQVQRMIETIRSVLDRTRDRALERAPVELAPLIAEVLSLVSTRFAGRALATRCEVAPDLPPVPGDVVGLRQVLLNLLTNAMDATEPPGTITVSATLMTPDSRASPHIELSVRDTGHGMGREELRRAVEPFYTTKGPGRGTGLGLAIVDHIVRAHGGHLVIDSQPGRGTTMSVRLPLGA